MKTVKNVAAVVAMAAALGFGSAQAEELILVVESCADAACAVESINDEITAEIEWSLSQQLKKMEAQFAVPVVASVEQKQRRSRDGRRLSDGSMSFELRL